MKLNGFEVFVMRFVSRMEFEDDLESYQRGFEINLKHSESFLLTQILIL